MVHGDDRGLVLPPRIAPIQAVMVPIISKKAREEVLAAARRLAETLQQAGIRLKLDDREGYSPGWKFNEWEMKGVPLRIELGPRDLAAEQVVLVRRDSGAKEPLPWAELPRRLPLLLEELQGDLYRRALQFQQEHTRSGADYDEFLQVMERERGFFVASWCGREECELKAKEDSKATIRCIPFDRQMEHENCIVCGGKAAEVVYFARAY
jgi:prolyl-tRNA synthetase